MIQRRLEEKSCSQENQIYGQMLAEIVKKHSTGVSMLLMIPWRQWSFSALLELERYWSDI
jgi:hypothetical protein